MLFQDDVDVPPLRDPQRHLKSPFSFLLASELDFISHQRHPDFPIINLIIDSLTRQLQNTYHVPGAVLGDKGAQMKGGPCP